MLLKILIYLFIIISECIANDPSIVRWQLKPEKVDFSPLQASLTEPRFGLSKAITTSTMKIDLGNSVDLIRLFTRKNNADDQLYAAGIDFFTYARVTGWEGMRLQVDAVDGFFGGHLTHSIPINQSELQLRLRFLHLSAHYVDGHFDQNTGQWKTNREPIPFTRDMADLTAAFKCGDVRLYLLLEHAFRIRPFNQRRTWYQAGGEWFLGHLSNQNLHPYIAEDIRLVGFESYNANWASIVGIKLGEVYGSGINLFLRYYSGVGPFSEYFDLRINEWSLGFSIDYW